MTRQRPFAVFDIDGTLIRWQLYHAIFEALAHEGLVDPRRFQDVRNARISWKKRTGETSFRTYENEMIKVYDESLQDITYEQFLSAARDTFDEYKEQTYTYTRDLLKQLKADNYLLFAISASQLEVVELLARYYGFDDWAGSLYKRDGNRFNGAKEPLLSARKVPVLQELVKKHHASYKGSIGIGDSESDIPMLGIVEQPIAFNPTKQLFEHARTDHWRIMVERKNMVYQLEPSDGHYRLRD